MAISANETSGMSTYRPVMDLIRKSEAMRSKQNIDKAKIYLSEAQEMNKKIGDPHLKASILEGFGLCYYASGDYEKAFETASNAIDLFKKIPGPPGEFGNANGLLSLGNVHRQLGRYKEAIACQEQAIEILVRLTNSNDPVIKSSGLERIYEKHLGAAYGNMGETHTEMGEYVRGLELSQEALKVSQKMGDKLIEAGDLHNVGKAYSALGMVTKAIQCRQKSACIFEEIGNTINASKSYAILALCHLRLNELKTSEHYHQMCVKINEEMQTFAVLAMVYGNRGLLYYTTGFQKFLSLGDSKEALENSVENFKLAIESTDKILASLTADNNRTAFSDRFYRWYDHLTPSFNLLGRSTAALLSLDLGRAKILRKLVYRQVKPRQNDENQLAIESSWLAIQKKEEKQRICDLSREIQPMESDTATVLFYNFNQHQILTIWVSDANGGVSLKTTDPSEIFATAQQELEVTVTELLKQASASLPRGFSFFNQLSVVDFQDENAKAETTSCDDREAKVSEIKRNNRSPSTRAGKSRDDLAKETRSSLYRALISPVKKFIKGTKLIIAPQRCLFFAPFSSFIDENGCVLSEKYQIQIIPSIHVLAMSIQSSSSKPIGNSLFVGDPDVQLAGLSRLPYAAEEVEYLASLLDSKPLLGPMAAKKKVSELIPEASIIHIAAHGDEQTGHIFLAPEASKPIAHQTSSSYLLTQSDILKSRLTARLVVLSCCHTGKGKVSSEGVLGIARSFLGAGASCVLVSLWPIDDKFTKLFMTAFYEKILEGKFACLALKETMNEFQRSGKYKSFMFWAAFEIMGEDVRFSKSEIKEIRQNNKSKI